MDYVWVVNDRYHTAQRVFESALAAHEYAKTIPGGYAVSLELVRYK